MILVPGEQLPSAHEFAMNEIASNVERVKRRIAEAATRSGRAPDEIKLVAVSKMVEPERIRQALDAGIRCLGENKVQEAQEKKPQLEGYPFEFHLIGPLQKNKVNRAIATFDWIETVDSLDLARKLDISAERAETRLPVLVQVNIGKEPTKSGVVVEDLEPLIRSLEELRHLSVEGLMTIPPYRENPEEVRPYFRSLRELAERVQAKAQVKISMKTLSMGMSHDYEVAIEEGATLVRVGTAIFGERPPH